MNEYFAVQFPQAASRLNPTFVNSATRLGSPTSCRRNSKKVQFCSVGKCAAVECMKLSFKLWIAHLYLTYSLDTGSCFISIKTKVLEGSSVVNDDEINEKLGTPNVTFCPWRHALSLFTNTLAAHLLIKDLLGNLSIIILITLQHCRYLVIYWSISIICRNKVLSIRIRWLDNNARNKSDQLKF